MTETTNIISFPKLGIYDLNIDRVAIGGIFGTEINIYWYAIIITFGMILAMSFCMWRAKDFGITSDNIIDVALWGVPISLVGARVYYVLMRLDRFENFWEMINFRNGGLAIYGAVIAAFATGLIYSKIKKINALALFDCASLGFFIGQLIGRWGNFFNAEAHGTETTLPWGMTINDSVAYHPTFLYESLWNLAGFLIAFFIIRKIKKADGEVFFFYMGWYGLGRAFIEQLRTDSLYIFDVIRVSQLLGALFFIASVVCIILIRTGVWGRTAEKIKAKRIQKKGFYSPVFESDENNGNVSIQPEDTDLFVAQLEAHKNIEQENSSEGEKK